MESIDLLPISNRAKKCLHKAGIDTMGQLLKTPPYALQNIYYLGPRSFSVIQDALKDYRQKKAKNPQYKLAAYGNSWALYLGYEVRIRVSPCPDISWHILDR